MRDLFKGFGRGHKTSTKTVEHPPLKIKPRHIGIIMDGNGRWARKRGLPRMAGHHAGMLAMREAIRACDDFGIECITLYAFSTENWKRPLPEVEYLMRLPEQFFRTEIDELVSRGVQVRFMGDIGQLPLYTQETVKNSLEKTAENMGMTVNFALNYGGRAELISAMSKVAEDVSNGRIGVAELTEESFETYLDTAGLPPLDLVIRTSGEIRLSNFLIWQSAYAELWFTDVLWPDFNKDELYKAIVEYGGRKRRFGDVE
ncbi:isoprenyl transferase [Alicyclobacillus dauci]|uniref:Isoprenyl transferase n=1 Tax=Alicyclobacillus dauci TaxID=1475485 RepID=A0ABY6YZ19_9BACL|nr:isoprenyl transferase [Alicyclobacillus dauci]WAH35376.1 isoprenyl transferase [Alicyclobacillus dauci]